MLAVVAFAVAGARADDAVCLTDAELIERDDSQLAEVSPCSLTGAAYLYGKGHAALYLKRLPSDDSMQYYYLIRPVLRGLLSDDASMTTGLNATLLAVMGMLPGIDGHEADRGAWYRAFILRRYLMKRQGSISDEKALLNYLSLALLNDGTFNRFSELDCFIENDIPSVSVRDILASKAYTDCVAGIR